MVTCSVYSTWINAAKSGCSFLTIWATGWMVTTFRTALKRQNVFNWIFIRLGLSSSVLRWKHGLICLFSPFWRYPEREINVTGFVLTLHGVSTCICVNKSQGFQLLGIAWREKHRPRSARTHKWGPGPPSAYYRSPGGVQRQSPWQGEGFKAAPLVLRKILHLRISKCTILGPFSV